MSSGPGLAHVTAPNLSDDIPNLSSRSPSSSTLASSGMSQASTLNARPASTPAAEKLADVEEQSDAPSNPSARRWAAVLGGKDVEIGSRLRVRQTWFRGRQTSVSDANEGKEVLQDQLNQESDSDIQYRTCSWPKTAALLFAEYIGLAIMCFPATYSELGWIGGVIATLLNAIFYQYTSLILWKLCLRHPEVKDICDIGQLIFGGPEAWWITTAMFVLNNVVSVLTYLKTKT